MRQRLVPNEEIYIKFNSFSEDSSVIVAKVIEFYDLKDSNDAHIDKNNYESYKKMLIVLPKESSLILKNNCFEYFKKEYNFKCFHRGIGNKKHLKGKFKTRSRPILLTRNGENNLLAYQYNCLNLAKKYSSYMYPEIINRITYKEFIDDIRKKQVFYIILMSCNTKYLLPNILYKTIYSQYL